MDYDAIGYSVGTSSGKFNNEILHHCEDLYTCWRRVPVMEGVGA